MQEHTNDEWIKGLIRHFVIEAIGQWDKRVIVTAVTFAPPDIDRHVLPTGRLPWMAGKLSVPAGSV